MASTTTNFFTFLDSFNQRAKLPQRGHAKQGHDNLRLLGLAVLATTDCDVPLLHHTYAGNQHDSVMFHSVVDQLFARCRALSEEVDQITLVFDKGNNSEVLDLVEQGPLHFVGSLVPTQHEDLMAIQRQQMRRLDRSQMPAVWAYRTEKKVFGRNRTVLVTFNQQLFNAQQKTLTLEINKRKRKLEKLQDKLQRTGPEDRGKKPSVAGIENNVKEILPGRHMKNLFSTQVTKTQEGLPRLRFQSSGDRKVERGVAERRLLFETLPLVAEMDVEDFGYACGVVSVEAAQRCWCVVESGLGA